VALYVIVIALVLVFRVGQPFALSMRHRFRVAEIRREGPNVVSVYITGRDLDRLPVRAGQFFYWRFLSGGGWWRSHPFSLSAAPNGQYLRITVKDSGDDSRLIQHLAPGTRVFAEGPYGAFTGARRRHERVLLIAGGIGITPLRALLEEFRARPGAIVVLYRASTWDDVVFREELDALAQAAGAKIHYLVGRREVGSRRSHPLDTHSIARIVPDAQLRDVFVCGPEQMIDAVRRNLRALHVPSNQIHAELFAY
jgi:ferredoxin-NADP reductase